MKKMGKHGFSAIEIVLAIVMAGAIIALGWYVWSQRSDKSADTNKRPSQATSSLRPGAPNTEDQESARAAITTRLNDFYKAWIGFDSGSMAAKEVLPAKLEATKDYTTERMREHQLENFQVDQFLCSNVGARNVSIEGIEVQTATRATATVTVVEQSGAVHAAHQILLLQQDGDWLINGNECG